jgi:3-hydroxybutyryl-CoA dehydratase
MVLDRPGGIFVSQSLRFLRPVFPGDTIEASTEVVEIDVTKRRLHCKTTCTNQHGKLVIDGEAVLQKDAT